MGFPAVDLAGQQFGRLLVISRDGQTAQGAAAWRCRCICGNETKVSGRHLRMGQTTSCGCLQKEQVAARSVRHGKEGTKVYRAWHGMLYRCQNPRARMWKRYGGRGITVCERWQKFENFYADMGEPPTPAHSLDRVNNDGNYEPGNVRWTTMDVQGANRSNSVLITHEGRTLTLAGWARALGLRPGTLKARHYAGWAPPDLFRVPESGVGAP